MSTIDSLDTQQLEQQIQLLQARLEQAQRMAAVGELMSTTTHEFNNLLMTILNYAKLGLRYKDAESREKAFTRILDASNKAARLTGSVLALARNRSGEFEPTDLKQVIDDVLLLMERELTKYRIHFEKRIDSVPHARAIGNQIQRVILNLLINARQAMPNGGTILLGLQHDAEQGQVVLTIRDSGTGIAPEILPKIFDPFFSTKTGPDATGKGGTGLGLAACREIIEAHQGRIRVESSVGRGTAFIIRLPVAAA